MSWPAKAAQPLPLKIVTCELLLHSLKKLATQGDALSSVEYIRSRVEYRVGSDLEGSLRPVLYDGPSSEMTRESGLEVLRRLNALALSFEKNADIQLVALEFRGKDNIEKALTAALRLEPRLTETYRQIASGAFTPRDRIASTAINAATSIGGVGQSFVLAGTLGSFVTEPSFLSAGVALMNAALWLLPLNLGQNALEHRIARHDWLHRSLIRFLQQTILSKPDDRFLMMGSNMTLPLEYHRMLMNFDPSRASIEGGRVAGVRALGTGLTLKCMAGRKSPVPEERSAFLDHLVYFDGETMEPVWIAVYRAYCPRAGNLSARPEIESLPESDWSPSIVPAGL